MSKAKRPKSKNIDKAKKAVSDNSKVTGGASRCPVWRFQRYDGEGRLSPSKHSEFWSIAVEKMKRYESMTWSEIERSSGTKTYGNMSHFVDVATGVEQEFQKRLVELGILEDSIYSLHLEGPKKLIGIRDKEVFDIIWYDPDHSVTRQRKR